MEKRIDSALEKHNMTYLEMLRKIAITCDEFILFAREKKYDPKFETWPKKCGEVFSDIPILTGFGTCFITNPSYKIRWVASVKFLQLISVTKWCGTNQRYF